MKKLINILLVACFIFLCFACSKKSSNQDTASDFEIELLDGTKTSLYELTSQGKPVFINFWATWCPPCRQELPDLDSFANEQKQLGDKAQMTFIAICISDKKSVCQSFVQENNYSFTVAIDEKGVSASKYNVEAIPTSLIISSDNKILKRVEGMLSDKALQEFVTLK